MFSYWEKQSFLNYDVAVVGSGITGLSTAISIKQKHPNWRIIILEKGFLPTGASTKNAGFACVGSLTEILDDLTTLSQEEALALVKRRKEGLELLRSRLGDKSIDYKEEGSFELLFEKDLQCLEEMSVVNNLLHPLYEKDVFSISNKKFGFSTNVKSVVQSSVEGSIDTGKMMYSLLQLASSLGIEVKTNCPVDTLDEQTEKVEIKIGETLISAKHVAVCTNAFTKKLLPELELQPGRGQVCITMPIENLPFKGIYHFDEGYYYFRTIHNRVLFGGGRNKAFDKETTTQFALNEDIQQHLVELLKTTILPQTSFEIETQWAGIMAFGDTKEPIIKSISNRIHCGVRLGGMGIAIGSKVGEMLASKI